MDHRISKDMISQGMSVKGEKTTEELNNTQMGKVATPHNMLDAYRSMYENKEDVKEEKEEVNELVVTGTLAALGALAAKGGAAATAVKAGGAALAAKGAAAAGAAKAGAGALAAKGAGAIKAVKATGLASKAKTASNVANVASLVPSGGDGSSTLPSGSRSGTLAAGNELDGDVIQELIDSGKFSEEEIKNLTEISADTALAASRGADKKRGQLAAAGDKEGAKAKAQQSSRLYAASGEKRKKEPVAIPDRSFPKGKGKDYKEG